MKGGCSSVNQQFLCTIAENQNISVVIWSVVSMLNKAGLVKSIKGRGGYILGDNAKITVKCFALWKEICS